MSPAGGDVEIAVQRMKIWRNRAVAEGQPGAHTIRDIHLSMVARSGRRTPSAIAEVLPQALKPFAGALAKAMLQPPATPGPGQSGTPGQSGPAQTGPAQTGPAQTGPAQTGPGGPSTAVGAPPRNPATPLAPTPEAAAHPGNPVQSGRSSSPSQASPASHPGPTQPGPTQPGPTQPGPTQPGPTQAGPAPSGPASGVPAAPTSGASTAPTSDTAAASGETAAQRQERLAAEWEKFAPLDFSEMGGEPGRIQAAAARGGAIRLRWQPPEDAAPYTVYRVVSGDDYAPYDPQNADFVEITTELSCIDDRKFGSAIRHLQVWRNSGANQADAYASQPILHAQLPVVSPVDNVDLREDEGRVIGQWTTFPGVRRVQIYRIPIERAQSGFGDPAYRILSEDANLGGFVDHEAQRGKRYVYQFFCEAEFEGLVRLSAPTTEQLLVSAVLEPVTDLAIELDNTATGAQFDLTWSSPSAGNVVIFRTQRPPRAGAAAEAQPESALPQMGLPDESRLVHPIVYEDAGEAGTGATGAAPRRSAAMRRVPWPRGWVRTYFTPVTMLDGKVQVGEHIPAVRTMGVSDPVVVERTHSQVLKFGWPPGAAEVSVFLGAKGQPAEELIETAQRMDITARQYERLGGMHFDKALPSSGCSVHMVGVSYSAGERVESAPATVEYPGLLRLRYAVEQRRGRLGRGAPSVLFRIASEVKLTHAPPFLVVHNPERLPLEISDGDPVDVTLDDGNANQPVRRFVPDGLAPEWSQQVWQASPPGPGFIRLFLDLPPERLRTVALLDPDINTLIVRG